MINIAFMWHMHQPCYKDDLKGKYLLPWARLHGVKDYYPMAALLEKFDNVKAVFNMVPAMVEQILDYAHHGASDTFLDLTMIRAADLTITDKAHILEHFFKVNWPRLIEPHPRYKELLAKRGVNLPTDAALKKIAAQFSTQEILDLQVLFNLVWFHSITLDADRELKDIYDKEEGYTEDDKAYVVKKQREILAEIVPLYRRLKDAGRIEITVTPYYHPILPLLCNTDIAKIATPGMTLPKPKFSHPEDARWHVREAVKFHKQHFGSAPQGMWPSEGSVSEEALSIIMESGIKWVATDEDILFNSLQMYDRAYRGTTVDRRLVYQPYRFQKGSRHVDLIFRDKNLSNLISFTYANWDPQMAALDLLEHYYRIADHMRRFEDNALATIVMDGENAWEYFEDNGRAFFELLYSRLDDDEELKTTTIADYLKEAPPRKVLKNIFPGSWIEHNFKIWIGAPQDNLAWQYLTKARRDLVQYQKTVNRGDRAVAERIEKAWHELYIAEGSDWNWWYGPENNPGPRNPFDTLFRTHLRNIYKLIRQRTPAYLSRPIV